MLTIELTDEELNKLAERPRWTPGAGFPDDVVPYPVDAGKCKPKGPKPGKKRKQK